MSDPSVHEAALRDVGYTVFPGVYSDAFIKLCASELERLYGELGRPPMSYPGRCQHSHPVIDAFTTAVGVTIAKLLRHAPSLISEFFHPEVLATMRHVLGEDLHIETSGATLSDNTRPIHGWHNHVGGLDEDMPASLRPGKVDPNRIGRMTMLIYLDEVNAEMGPLLVYPRKLDDPLESPISDRDQEQWDGQVAINCPAGSAILIEERTWHASLPRSGAGIRRFLGVWMYADWVPTPKNLDDSIPEFEDAALHR